MGGRGGKRGGKERRGWGKREGGEVMALGDGRPRRWLMSPSENFLKNTLAVCSRPIHVMHIQYMGCVQIV